MWNIFALCLKLILREKHLFFFYINVMVFKILSFFFFLSDVDSPRDWQQMTGELPIGWH